MKMKVKKPKFCVLPRFILINLIDLNSFWDLYKMTTNINIDDFYSKLISKAKHTVCNDFILYLHENVFEDAIAGKDIMFL